jgi:opacity protein-like surface antigen
MTRIGLGVACVMLLGAATSAAQGVRYGVGAGLLLPVGDYHSLDKLGWIAAVDGTYWLASGSLGIRAEASYSRTGQREGACCLTDHTTAFGGGMIDVVNALGKTPDQVRPYLVAGVGLYNWRLSAPGFTPASETKFGFGGGAGVAYKVGRGSTRIFLESKVTDVSVNGIDLISVPIRVGVRFGANPRP